MSKITKPQGLFKHDHIFTGYAGSTPYLSYNGNGPIDGIGRRHVNLYGVCDICNKKILVAIIHVDRDGKLYEKKTDKHL